MERAYVDKHGRAMSREEVHRLPPEMLSERSGIPVHILPDRESLYDAIAEVMIETIEAKKQGVAGLSP